MSTARDQPSSFDAILESLQIGHGTLDEEATYQAFSLVMQGRVPDDRIVLLLSLLQHPHATVDELTGAARVMREHVTPVPIDSAIAADIVDTCGTGGAPKTFNISTGAAIVAAGAGAKVPKHGNRSRTGRGSAEVLEQLGVNVNATPAIEAKCLADAGVSFSFAINHHPAIKYAMPARRIFGKPSIFNLLGPLTNPAGATRQLIGVYQKEFTPLLAQVLARLGAQHAMIVHGLDGLDEMTITAPTQVSELVRGEVRTTTIDATEYGLPRCTLAELQVDTLESAASCIMDILEGKSGPKSDVVCFNAGAALMVAGVVSSLRDGIKQAQEAIETGKALQVFQTLVATSNS